MSSACFRRCPSTRRVARRASGDRPGDRVRRTGSVDAAPARAERSDVREQWHYMSPPPRWAASTCRPHGTSRPGAASIVVAVIDTGSLPAHPDLAGRFVGGYDFISDSLSRERRRRPRRGSHRSRRLDHRAPRWPSGTSRAARSHNSSFHGTHVAGTIGAASNNGTGVAGHQLGEQDPSGARARQMRRLHVRHRRRDSLVGRACRCRACPPIRIRPACSI